MGRKFNVDFNDIMDEDKEIKEEPVVAKETPVEQEPALVPVLPAKVEKTTKATDTKKKKEVPAVEESTVEPASPFVYNQKKEKRDVKKLLLITPTMNKEITELLKDKYNEMPFNMLVNGLLKEFLEKHGKEIPDNVF